MRYALSLALMIASCHGSPGGTGREPDEYTGCSSDEHWRVFSDNTATTNDLQAPVFSSPMSGATVPSASKPEFAWSQTPSSPGQVDGDVPHTNGPGCDNCCPQYNIGALTTLHLPTISGNLYDIQVTVGGQVAHRVITTLQKWTPPDAVWNTWKGQTVSVRIVRMAVLRNDPREGPFVASMSLMFSVGN